MDWTFPYPSQRMPVFARNVVATSQPLAAQAGLDMLRAGGNAIDAAIATAIALTVVEPTSNGIGSDAFALVWAGGGLHGMNASGRSPANMTRESYDDKTEISRRGWDGITVPGCVSGWTMLSKQFGRLPFDQLFQPAVRYARDGFLVSPQTAYYWNRGSRAYDGMTAWQNTFAPDGRAPRVGEQFRSEDHAVTLEDIASTQGESFYRGALASRIAEASRAGGGAMTEADLAQHEAEWVRPISVDYNGWTLNEIPPNGQGLVALIALGMLRHLDVKKHGVDSPEGLHLQIEAMKLAFADGHRYIADIDFMTNTTVEDLLDDAYLRARAAEIDPARAIDPKHGTPKPGGTIYLTAADDEGNMVSYIQSNYTGFGSGIVVPGTGIALQNRGCCFTLERGHPNELGPSKRPYHTIIPGFVTKDGQPVMSFGVMGGYMQPQGHAQVVVRMADYDQNPQAAIDAPRWQVGDGMEITIEPGFADDVYDALSAMGHDVRRARARTVSHGRGQAIYRLEDGYVAASDGRADGQAVGY
ncbi:MAG: gamma-glutamyltransferase [Planctomycetota bacterium]